MTRAFPLAWPTLDPETTAVGRKVESGRRGAFSCPSSGDPGGGRRRLQMEQSRHKHAVNLQPPDSLSISSHFHSPL